MELVIYTTLLFFLLILFSYFFLFKEKYDNPRLPPGSLGLPLIGSSLSFDKALKYDRIEQWFQKGMAKYGPIWKASLYGHPTVLLHGPAANKFLFTYDGNILTAKQPPPFTSIMGEKAITELTGDDHKRVREAVLSFLKLDALKQYIAKIDEEIQHHLQTHWNGKHEIQVQSLIKVLTFNIICSLLFGVERGPKREKLLPLLNDMVTALYSIPLNLPFTNVNRGISARKKLIRMIQDLMHEKKEALEKKKQEADYRTDLITLLLSIRYDDSSLVISDEEIIDTVVMVMIAGYHTTSSLISFLVKLLAENKSIYSTIVQEQEEISKSKSHREALTWDDLKKMQYTWNVASEMLRITPPVPVNFRRAMQDIEFGGYLIPKGWQVLVCPINTHMNNAFFQNPTLFDPTRFEKDAPSPPAYSLVPFGAGLRMCPGMALAKMETLTLLHHLVTNFTWELAKKDESFTRVPVPEFDEGLLVRINPIGNTLAGKA